MLNAEFKIGDLVTYKPYETAYPTEVHDVFEDNGTILYKLRTVPDNKQILSSDNYREKLKMYPCVTAVTSGKCIGESCLNQ